MDTFVGWVLAYAVVWLVSMPLEGLVISASWDWFVAPITGAQTIGVVQGIGLAIFLSIAGAAMTGAPSKMAFDAEKSIPDIAAAGLRKMIGVGILGPLVGLAAAWIWHTIAAAIG